jgi:hypothetical protein
MFEYRPHIFTYKSVFYKVAGAAGRPGRRDRIPSTEAALCEKQHCVTMIALPFHGGKA